MANLAARIEAFSVIDGDLFSIDVFWRKSDGGTGWNTILMDLTDLDGTTSQLNTSFKDAIRDIMELNGFPLDTNDRVILIGGAV